MKTQDYQEIINSLLPSEIHTLDKMLESGNRVRWLNALERIAKLSKEKREERDSNVIAGYFGGVKVKDYKLKPISQDVANNNEWTTLQIASGAIAIIVASLIFTISNL